MPLPFLRTSPFRRTPWVLLLVAVVSADPNTPGRSGIPAIDTLTVHEWDTPLPRTDLRLALPLAALTPGGGHYYTKRYVRAGFLTAIELYLASEVLINYDVRTEKHREKGQRSLAAILPLLDSLSLSEDRTEMLPVWRDSVRRELSEYRKSNDMLMEEKGLRKSHIAWWAGLQLYGVLDTWTIIRRAQGRSYEKRSVGETVAWAVFLPGAGQILNEEWGKAGLLYMSFIGSAVSFQARQETVSWYLNRVQVARQEGQADEVTRLEDRLSFFRKKRNQYVWAPLLFYFYSIADAAVDAILSDFDAPRNLAFAPWVEPEGEGVGLRLAWDF